MCIRDSNIIAAVKIHRQADHFIYTKGCARDIVGGTVDAVSAVIDAVIIHQDVYKRQVYYCNLFFFGFVKFFG